MELGNRSEFIDNHKFVHRQETPYNYHVKSSFSLLQIFANNFKSAHSFFGTILALLVRILIKFLVIRSGTLLKRFLSNYSNKVIKFTIFFLNLILLLRLLLKNFKYLL